MYSSWHTNEKIVVGLNFSFVLLIIWLALSLS